MKKNLARILILATGLGMFACSHADKKSETVAAPAAAPAVSEPQQLSADLEARSGSKVTGHVTIEKADANTLLVKYEIKGLGKKTVHGFHIHDKGDCSSPDAASAGGHWNPSGHQHGTAEATDRHAGDLGNITANKKGIAKGEVKVAAFLLSAGQGHAVIVHEKADDFKTQPTGNAGSRIACGVLK